MVKPHAFFSIDGRVHLAVWHDVGLTMALANGHTQRVRRLLAMWHDVRQMMALANGHTQRVRWHHVRQTNGTREWPHARRRHLAVWATRNTHVGTWSRVA